MRRAAHRQEELEREMHALSATVTMLEAKIAAMHKPVAPPPAPVRQERPATLPTLSAMAEEVEINPQLDGVDPEIVPVLIAAAQAALGRGVRLISARLVPAFVEKVSPWSQQGRVLVQTSHNLR